MILNPFMNVIFGFGMLVMVIYQLFTNMAFGRIRKFSRQEDPLYFWFLIFIELIVSLTFFRRYLF